MTRVVVSGATGTIGRALVAALRERGDEVVVLSRDPDRAAGLLGGVEAHAWPEPKVTPPSPEALSGAEVVINLAGERVDQRWSVEAKREIRESRVLATRSLVTGLLALPEAERPAVLVSQSAIGYYGSTGAEPLTEEAPPGSDFLAGVVAEWEREARAAEQGMRVVITRTGVVLSTSGGALAKMLPFFRAGLGGPVAGGRQYVAWIHLDDVVGALLRCADDQSLAGPVNLTAPSPATNRELTRALASVLHRPAIFPVPGAALQLLYGEMSQIVTTGQRVVPARLESCGYAFIYPKLEPALRELLGRGDG